MEEKRIKEALRNIFISVLEHEEFEIQEQLTAADVDGWDSLSHMLIVTEIEETFSIKFKFRELNRMKNLGNMMDLIIAKIG